MTNGQGFLSGVLGGITSFAQHHLTEYRINQERLAVLRDDIERIVDVSEPRIRLVGNYLQKLLDPVEDALAYGDHLLRQIPPAVALGGQSWARDPRVNAFFATQDDLRFTLGHNPRLRSFFEDKDHRECFALMLMVKREIETFGSALDGDMLVREVRQIRISFSNHQLFFPNVSEAKLRRELRERTLIFLATRALERINELRERRGNLEERRRQLQVQLRALRGHARGLQPLLSSTDADERRLAALDQKLAQTEQDLVIARKQLGTLDDYLEQVRQVLSQPEKYLEIQPLSMRINRLGLKLDENSSEPGETITLIELASLGEKRIGVLVRFARDDLAPSGD
ncbi:MAG TPA: hypothetical protein PKY50_00235 [Candidatus Competibacter sp.]|nr:hypothetical protein [Candidatus Competibacter sp.]